MRRVIGVVGRVDHGKTALVQALTGMETDRLAEEKRRGISIVLGFAHLALPGIELDFIDMPGHERFVRTMVSGATGIDGVAAVVAANEGIKPQTIEHLDIVGLLGVRRTVIVVAKADLVEQGQAECVARDAAAIARRVGLDVQAAVLTSAVTGQGMPELLQALAALAVEPVEPDAGFPYLPIDRVFTIAGHGTVVTGTLRRGPLSMNDAMELVPSARPVRLRALQVHGRHVPAAQPGQRVAANLRDIEPGELRRGAALAGRGLLRPSSWLSVMLRLVESAPPLRTGQRFDLLFGTEEVGVRLRLLDRDEALAGQTAPAQVQCDRPVSVPSREAFILRRTSPSMTVAGGCLLDPDAVRLRRRDPAVLAGLAALAQASPEQIVLQAVEVAAANGAQLTALSRLAGVAPSRAAAWLAASRAHITRSGFVVARQDYDRFVEAVKNVLAGQASAHPDGLKQPQLLALLPEAGIHMLEEAVSDLVGRGLVQQEGGRARWRQPEQQAARDAEEALLAGRLAETLRQGGLSPPDPATAAPDFHTKRVLDRLVREGVAVRARDHAQKRDVLFHREAVAEAQRRLAPLLAPPGLLVSEAGAALGISRKYSVPLLEYFDGIRYTRRVADRRVLARTEQAL